MLVFYGFLKEKKYGELTEASNVSGMEGTEQSVAIKIERIVDV